MWVWISSIESVKTHVDFAQTPAEFEQFQGNHWLY